MRWRDRGIVLLLVVVAIGGFLFIPSFGRPYTAPAVWDGAPQFQTERAWADIVTLAVRFPRRWSGTADRGASADWLAGTLQAIGLEVHRDSFQATLGDLGRVDLENIWGISRGLNSQLNSSCRWATMTWPRPATRPPATRPPMWGPCWNWPGDTVDKMRPESVQRYGRVMERILRTIDAMPAVFDSRILRG